MSHALPYSRQTVDEEDLAAVCECLRDNFLTGGSRVGQFERALAAQVDAPGAVACSSGTAALHLSMLALGIGPGDSVVVPSITFLATANAARYVGADVTFADVDPTTGLMGAEHIIQAMERTGGRPPAAIIPVHLAGQCANLEEIAAVAARWDAYVVEDASHALGTVFGDTQSHLTGSCQHSDVTVFSFHPVKTIAMGEGGALTSRSEAYLAAARTLRNHGMIRDSDDRILGANVSTADMTRPWYYEMPRLGFNYRVSDIHCALGLSQLRKVDKFIEERRRLVGAYDRLLAPLSPMIVPLSRTPSCRPGWHLYVVLIDFPALGQSRSTLMKRLAEKGIGTQVHYIPVNSQPYYRDLYGEIELPGAEAYYSRCLSLPLFPSMTLGDVERVVAELVAVIGRA